LLKRALKALGKSLLIVTGVGYGVFQALDALAGDSAQAPLAHGEPEELQNCGGQSEPVRDSAPRSDSSQVGSTAPIEANQPLHCETAPNLPSVPYCSDVTRPRLDGMEERLIRIEKGLEILTALLERAAPQTSGRTSEHPVTHAELNAAMEQLASRLDNDMERRFEVQNRSVQSLRTMIARTDELLERVIESIESTSLTA